MEKINISFAGCGFLGIYHVGVASCFKEYAPHLLLNKISGASIGALAACALLTDVPLGEFTSQMLGIIYELRSRTLGPFNPLINVTNLLENNLKKSLPANAYKVCSGRLHVSMTRVSDGVNVIISEFNSNEELLKVLLASAFVPVFSGFIPPRLGNERYIDGGFSNNLPILDENTITVSPFCGESDICPRDSSLQLFHVNFSNTSIEISYPNIYRLARILFPPSPEVLSLMCKQGFEDALKFLQRNDMISCTKCLAVQTTISVPVEIIEKVDKKVDQHENYDPECEECVKHRQKAAVSNLPEMVVMNFEHAIERANKGLYNWVFKHRGMKVVSIIGLPYLLGIDVMRATLKKTIEIAPNVIENLEALSKYFIEILVNLLKEMNRTGVLITSKVFGKQVISVATDEKGISRSLTKENIPVKTNYHIAYDTSTKLEQVKAEETPKVSIYSCDSGVSDDTYEHVLATIEQHDSLMAFYYMDDQNKMKIMEFFDVSHDETLKNDTTLDGKEVIGINEDNGSIIESWTMGNDQNLAKSYITPCLENQDDMTINEKSDVNDYMKESSSDPECEWPASNDKVSSKNKKFEPAIKKRSSFRKPSIIRLN